MMARLNSNRTMLRAALAATLLAVPSMLAQAQTGPAEPTGVLALDLRQGLDSARLHPERPLLFAGENGRQPKSVWLATGLSALVPGAGQYYTEAPLWRTILYGTVEVAGWTLFGVYSAKGEQATTDFETFADAHWDVTRYISWLSDNYDRWTDAEVDKQAAREALGAIYRSNDPSLDPWERVDFDQLNKLERAVRGGFSHTLPEHGEQQYYEQIGKYIQYRAGWDDHILEGDTIIFNPSRVTRNNRDYMDSRVEANDLLGYAGTALWVVALNHVVSAVDALLEARNYNVSIKSELKGETLPNGRRTYAPGLGLRFRF